MHISGNLIDSVHLDLPPLQNAADLELIVQDAVHALLQKWEDLIEGHNPEPEFFVKRKFPFR